MRLPPLENRVSERGAALGEPWNPKGLWDRLERAVRDWMDPGADEERDTEDPALLFHLCITMPLLIMVAALVRRAA
jgi:hypothetical protein